MKIRIRPVQGWEEPLVEVDTQQRFPGVVGSALEVRDSDPDVDAIVYGRWDPLLRDVSVLVPELPPGLGVWPAARTQPFRLEWAVGSLERWTREMREVPAPKFYAPAIPQFDVPGNLPLIRGMGLSGHAFVVGMPNAWGAVELAIAGGNRDIITHWHPADFERDLRCGGLLSATVDALVAACGESLIARCRRAFESRVGG